MFSSFDRGGNRPRRAGSLVLAASCAFGATLAVAALSPLQPALHAQTARTAQDGVYTAEQAKRGQDLFRKTCLACHGPTLRGSVGPALTGDNFMAIWGALPLSELVTKIQSTMPQNDPGTLTAQEATDVVAYLLQFAKFPPGQAELVADSAELKETRMASAAPAAAAPTAASSGAPAFPPAGNLAELMRGILFPSSNLVFNTQSQDPGAPLPDRPPELPRDQAFSWVDWGAGIYTGWDLVDYAAVAIAETAPLLLVPGRRCENGKPVPVDRADWIQYTQELAAAGRAAYKASQTRSQEAIIEATNVITDACLNCHVAYRDKPGGTPADPSNKAARCE
jgi:mono/diheme cytochrome c family protein